MIKLLKKGFYIVRIKDAKNGIDYDSKYSYDVYYFPRKKDKEFIKKDFNENKIKNYFMEIFYQTDSEKLLRQEGIDILYFDDYRSKFVVPKEKTNKKVKTGAKKVF